MSIARIAFLYTVFAIVAAAVNLLFQRACLWIYDGPYSLAPAILVGTVAGLLVKYVLDKRWIFADLTTGVSAQTKQFGLYTLMGVVTTAIFWGTEVGFYHYFETDQMREVGAAIGLTIGYVVKYQLDRKFVFNQAA